MWARRIQLNAHTQEDSTIGKIKSKTYNFKL